MRFVLILVLVLPMLAWAPPEKTLTLRSETRVVQIDIAVRDSHGLPVSGLTKEDFTIKDDGNPRAIAIFGANPSGQPADAISSPPQALSPKLQPGVFSNRVPSSGPPKHVTVILLDGVLAHFDDFAQAQRSIVNLMAKLPGTERIAIYGSYKPAPEAPSVLQVIQDFTSDRDLLRKSIAAYWPSVGVEPAPPMQRVKSPQLYSAQPPDEATRAVQHADALTTSFAVKHGSTDKMDFLRLIGEHLALLPGRKSLIWVTPGFPPAVLIGQAPVVDKTIAALNDANVALSAVDMRGLAQGTAPNIAA